MKIMIDTNIFISAALTPSGNAACPRKERSGI